MDCPACHTPNIDGARFCAKCGAPLPTKTNEADPLIGAVVGGRFRITGILGEGGMGRVYSGEQQMGTKVRKVAVKTLLAEHARDPQTVARFMRECGTVSELEHPNTIKVYDFGQTDTGELYIAMELLTGKSLEKELEDSGVLSAERADKILGQICGSLQEAHEKGIVHRDLKPANIQLLHRAGEDDYVKVLDFGIAKNSEPDSKQNQKLTKQGTILGTPPYMSPEQFKGVELDARSDIYSLGVVAYEMLSGRLPFEADTPWQWATQHMTAQPFPFETIPMAANVPPKMKNAVMRALSKEREKRPQTVREFYDEMTLGGVRMSMLGAAPRGSGSMPDIGGTGTSAMPARPGQTQLGEPLFAGGGGSPPGHTIVDPSTSTVPGSGPVVSAAPTAGGQVMAAAPPPKKSSSGPIIGVAAVIVVGLIVGVVVKMKGKSGSDDPAPTIAIPAASTPAQIASDAPPVSSAVPDAGVRVVGTSVPHSGGEDAACDEAIRLAQNHNTAGAVSKMSGCKGPRRGAASSAIGMAAQSEVSARKCGAKAAAQAAASIGERAALLSLPKSCQ